MTEELCEYLFKCGYNFEDSEEIHVAYYDGGIDAAVEKFSWADSDTEDYTGELREHIRDWQVESGEVYKVVLEFLD